MRLDGHLQYVVLGMAVWHQLDLRHSYYSSITHICPHSGRLTGVSIGCQLGASHEVLRAWMIVVSTATVVTYVRRDYSVGAIGRSLMEFLRDKA